MLAGSRDDESAATSSPFELSLRMPPVGGRATAAPRAGGHRRRLTMPWGGAGWVGGGGAFCVLLPMFNR